VRGADHDSHATLARFSPLADHAISTAQVFVDQMSEATLPALRT
jgi:hypothetical protein